MPGFEDLGLTHTFPDPATLSQADLSGIGMPGARAAAIKAFAAAVDKGDIPIDGRLPLDDLVARHHRGARPRAVDGELPGAADGRARRVPRRPTSGCGAPPAAGGEPLTTAALAERAEPWRPASGRRGRAALDVARLADLDASLASARPCFQ